MRRRSGSIRAREQGGEEELHDAETGEQDPYPRRPRVQFLCVERYEGDDHPEAGHVYEDGYHENSDRR